MNSLLLLTNTADFFLRLSNSITLLKRAGAGCVPQHQSVIRRFEDGRINIDNNPVENAIRGIAPGRKNYLFCGSEGGGHRAALMYSLIESAKINRINPDAYGSDRGFARSNLSR